MVRLETDHPRSVRGMYTEIKELCNFFVRYLRYRIPCQTLKDFIEHFANLLLVQLDPSWNNKDVTGQSSVNLLHWCVNGTTSDIFLKAMCHTGLSFDYLKALIPDKLIVAISPGLVTYHSDDESIARQIWEGDPFEDLDYDSSPLCAKVVYEPPYVTISKNRHGNVLYGKPLFGEENFSETAPAYLTDPMMHEGQFVMLLIKPMSDSFEYPYLNDFNGKVFKVERFVTTRQIPDFNLVAISQFHNTRFGSFRTNLATPPRILEVEDDCRGPVEDDIHVSTTRSFRSSSPPSNESSPSSSNHSQSSSTLPDLDFSKGPKMVIPQKLLQQLLTPEQKRILQMFNYPCE